MASKLKSHRGATKRIQLSTSGRLLRRHSRRNHFLSKRRPGHKRELSHPEELAAGVRKMARRVLGI